MNWRYSAAATAVLAALLVGAAQAQDRQPQPQASPQQPQTQQITQEADAVGSVATAVQPAVLARPGQKPVIIRKGADIRKGDELRTGAGGSLSIVLDDETTFTLTAEATITVNEFVYGSGNAKNAAAFNVARGTVSFIASQVAKTGDMTITTPSATLGIRGTTGIVEVPLSGPTQVRLYQDAGGTVGRIEMFGRDGARVGELTRAATGFTLQFVGQRLTAAPLNISAIQVQRDRALVQRAASHQTIGRQLNDQRRRDPGRRGQDGDRPQRRDGGRGDSRDGRQQGERNRDRREQGQRDRQQDQRRGRDQDGRDQRQQRERSDRDRRAPAAGERQRREGAPVERPQRDDGRPDRREGGPRSDPRTQRQPQPARPPLQQPPRQQNQRPSQQQPGLRPVPQQQQPRPKQQQPQRQKPQQQNQVPPR